MEKPFQGLATFLKSPVNDFSREIGVIGIPFDGATSYRPGARFAPNAIRQASMMLTDGGHPLFARDPLARVTDLGDIACSNLNVAKSLDQITTAFETHPFLSDPSKRTLSMGGDHTVTTGILRAIARQHPDLIVIHVDAHCDTWADHFGDPLGHGTWVRNVVEEGLVRADSIFQIGIRSPVDLDTQRWLTDRGGAVWTTREAMKGGAADVVRQIWFKLCQQRQERGLSLDGVFERPVYLSFDIDALDPAYAPGTGTPEMGGLSSIFALELVEALAYRLIGADLVEVNPSYDPTGITALAGATLLWTIAAGMASQ